MLQGFTVTGTNPSILLWLRDEGAGMFGLRVQRSGFSDVLVGCESSACSLQDSSL